MVTKLGFCDGLLVSLDQLSALKRSKELICLLLDRGTWTFSLIGPPVGDERRTSIWNVAREAEASPEDRQYWAELRTLWSQLKNFSLSPFLGDSIANGEITGLDYASLLQSWRPKYEELSDVKRLKEVVCLLLDRGKWHDFPLVEPPVGDERRTSVWNVAREVEASAEDRQYWDELRSLWSQLQYVRSFLLPFRALPQVGDSIVNGEITGVDYASLLHSWRPEYDEPESLHSRIHEALERSQTDPVQFDFAGCWLFKNNRYSIEGHYDSEEKKLLVVEEFDKERRHFERLHHKHRSAGSDSNQPGRPRVPEAVRIEVWRRDGGQCSRCGSRENLEYDHIVPLVRGGSNTARNVELLCEKCNRSKADKIE